MAPRKTTLTRRYVSYAALLLILAACAGVLWQSQRILDWLVLRDYVPPAQVVAVADETTMTPRARHLFYVNKPSFEDKASFNAHCPNEIEQSSVLGCYTGDRRGIYIYDVQDERLHGVTQVTAAHEMLHQAYDRLSNSERERIDGLLTDLEKTGSLSTAIAEKLDSYRKSEPNDVINEMHSIFGTEIAVLPNELEAYYTKYFADRAKVVALSEAYQGEFTKRRQAIEAYDKQLAGLKAQFEANEKTLAVRRPTIDAKRQEIDQDVTAKDVAEYNADVAQYKAMAGEYNNLVKTTQGLISQYNAIVEKRNAIALQQSQLKDALNSRADPVQ